MSFKKWCLFLSGPRELIMLIKLTDVSYLNLRLTCSGLLWRCQLGRMENHIFPFYLNFVLQHVMTPPPRKNWWLNMRNFINMYNIWNAVNELLLITWCEMIRVQIVWPSLIISNRYCPGDIFNISEKLPKFLPAIIRLRKLSRRPRHWKPDITLNDHIYLLCDRKQSIIPISQP